MIERWPRACTAVAAGLTSPEEVRRVLGFGNPPSRPPGAPAAAQSRARLTTSDICGEMAFHTCRRRSAWFEAGGVDQRMSEGELGRAGSITVEQLSALNEEIRALVRAGVPLERGLITAARDLGGRLGRITSALGTRLSRGESLVEALDAEKDVLPPLYRAVVEAGARSGQLPVALEGLAGYVRGYSEARSTIGLACGIRWWFSVSRMRS